LQTQIVYAKPPDDGALPDPAGTFNVVHMPFDTEATSLEAGEILVENQYLSIDPYHRFGLYDPAVTRSQFPVTKPGTVISTYGVSRVVRSANPEFAVGDLLYSWVRWERFTVVTEPNLQYLQKVKAGVDPVHYLGPLGAPGLTAYAGMTQIARPRSGETIVVSATTGAVGMVASQLAKTLGLTVVGMAGSDQKVRYLLDELSLDAAFNYRTAASLEDALEEHCPQGIDIFFDLVGGDPGRRLDADEVRRTDPERRHGLSVQPAARQALRIEEPAQHRRHGHHHPVLPQLVVGALGRRDAGGARNAALRRKHEVQDPRRRRVGELASSLPRHVHGTELR
jgi:NADPH-dependent curcumin reductase CurA